MRSELCKAKDCLKSKESEYHHTRDILSGLEAKQDDLTHLLSNRDGDLHSKMKKQAELNGENSHLKVVYKTLCDENDHLDHQLKHQLGQNDELTKNNCHGNNENKDHSGHVLSLEAKLREKDSHLHVLHKDADGLKAALDTSQCRKDELSEQLYAINKHISTLNDQNTRMSYELTDITEKDAQIRAALDRRHRIKDMNCQNEHLMKESMHSIHEVRSRSP